MSNTTKAVLYHTARPDPDQKPQGRSGHWSQWPSDPLQCTADSVRLFISGEGTFGSGKSQDDLKGEYLADEFSKLDAHVYVDPTDAGSGRSEEFRTAWDEAVEAHIKESVQFSTTKPGRKRAAPALTQISILKDNESKNTCSFKIKIPRSVLQDLYDSTPEEYRGETILDLPSSNVYKVIFKVSGIWTNASNYGVTLRGVRMGWARAKEPRIERTPKDFVFAELDDESEPED